MKTRLLLTLFVIALVQCNRSGEPPQVEVAPASPARPSVDILSEGLSPHFLTVASRLDVGGASFSYLETDASTDLISSLIEQVIEAMPAEEKANMPPNFSFKKIMALIGFDSIKAAGSSSRALPGGRHHARAFAYTPQGRSGLLSSVGGPAETLLTLQYAVLDTDLAIEFPLRTKDWFAEAWSTIMQMAPDEQRQLMEANLKEPIPGINATVRAVGDHLDMRLAVFASLRPDQQIPLPGTSMPTPGFDAALIFDRLGPLREGFTALLDMLPPGMFQSSEENGILSVRMSEPAMPPPMDYQPCLQLHLAEERLIVATRPAYLDALLGDTDKLTGKPEFAAAWTGLPEEGNGCLYVSSRFMLTLMDGIKQAIQAQPKAGASDSGQKAVLGIIDSLGKDLAAPQAFAYANEKDGILAAANSSLGGAQLGSLSGISTLAIVASIAVPAFSKIQHLDHEATAISSARQLGIALKAYAADHNGSYPPQLADLITEDILPDESVLLFKDPSSSQELPWLYNATLTDTSPGDAILLAAPTPNGLPSGKQTRVVVFNDLTTQSLPEETFQQRKDDNLR